MDTQKYIKPREKEGQALQLSIPDSVAQAIRMPEKYREPNLLIELAIALYAQEALSFGKARELAGMSTCEFGQLLGRREIPRRRAISTAKSPRPPRNLKTWRSWCLGGCSISS